MSSNKILMNNRQTPRQQDLLRYPRQIDIGSFNHSAKENTAQKNRTKPKSGNLHRLEFDERIY
jgi:hypothetical protein